MTAYHNDSFTSSDEIMKEAVKKTGEKDIIRGCSSAGFKGYESEAWAIK